MVPWILSQSIVVRRLLVKLCALCGKPLFRSSFVPPSAPTFMDRLAIFDFDHSLIDDNSDTFVVSLAPLDCDALLHV